MPFEFMRRILLLFLASLMTHLGMTPMTLAAQRVCLGDLDSRLQEVASLTLQYEIAQRGDDMIQRMSTQVLYQKAYTDLIQNLTQAQITILDAQIKEEIKSLQSRERVANVKEGSEEETQRDVEENLVYGPNFAIFEKLALKEGISVTDFRALFTHLHLQSFQYSDFQFPREGVTVKLGSPESEMGRTSSESLQEVTLTRSFGIQATPVTQIQWALVMGGNPSEFKAGGSTLKIGGKNVEMNPNRPVEKVSLTDMEEYILKLNQLDSVYTYRLPTEAEWEYAARAGTDTAYYFGDSPAELDQYAWSDDNSDRRTHDVAGLKPNAFGLYDLYGNVYEMTQDWYQSSRPAQAKDPAGPPSGDCMAARGGSWFNGAVVLRSASRHCVSAVSGNYRTGFRLVRTPK